MIATSSDTSDIFQWYCKNLFNTTSYQKTLDWLLRDLRVEKEYSRSNLSAAAWAKRVRRRTVPVGSPA
jgi:hypothetical protein